MADDYLDQLLSRDEVVLIDARQHWMAAIRFALKPIVLLVLVGVLIVANSIFDFDGALSFINTLVQVIFIIGAIVAVIWLPIDIIRWRSRKYVLTNRRAIHLEGVLTKNSFDSSLEKINDIETNQSLIGRMMGYMDLTIYTASDEANEDYEQLIDGLQFKKAVLEAKEAIRRGAPLEALPDGFVVKGGTNRASRTDGSVPTAEADGPAPATTAPPSPPADESGDTPAGSDETKPGA